jgi:hypothetical protein
MEESVDLNKRISLEGWQSFESSKDDGTTNFLKSIGQNMNVMKKRGMKEALELHNPFCEKREC